MITERARGAVGIINACEFCDVVQRVWELLDAGEQAAAAISSSTSCPRSTLEGLMGMAFAKEIMVRRGVFKNHRMRSQTHPLDDDDLSEIDRVWERIEPYLIWKR